MTRRAFLPALPLVVLGCLGDEGDMTETPEDSALEFAEASVGPEGGAVRLVTSSGEARVDVPPGALDREVVLRIERLNPAAVGSSNGFTADPVFAFLPHGTRFAAPVTVS